MTKKVTRDNVGAEIDSLTATAIVPVRACLPDLYHELENCPTNLDLTTWEGKTAVLAAGNPGDIVIGKEGFVEFFATQFIIFKDEGADPETGEVSEYARTVLFTADGRTFRTTSAHAPKRIAMAMRLFTKEEWATGIPFRIAERKSQKTGRTYHDIRVSRASNIRE